MKKPDRFERMVAAKSAPSMVLHRHDVVDLLRKEHAWMRRQLKAISQIKFGDGEFRVGFDTVIEELEYRLAQRRK